jgi:ABC-type polysaccharide/polyol phosphate export permease
MIKFFSDVKKYSAYMRRAAKSELNAEVANSYLNWIWWILEPLCFMAIYAVIFSLFFKGKIEYLTAFIFLGITIWEFFNVMLKTSVKLVRGNKAIVSKVYIPKYILLIEKMLRNGFKSMISFAIVLVLMVIYQVPLSWNVLWFFPVLLSFLIFTFGTCALLLHFGVYVEDLANITNIVLRLLFYMTGVFYNLADKVAGVWGYWLVRLNPLAMYLNSMRDALLYGRPPHWVWLGAWTVVGILLSYAGIRLIQKNENSYVKVL